MSHDVPVLVAALCIAVWIASSQAATALDFAKLMKMEKDKLAAEMAKADPSSRILSPSRPPCHAQRLPSAPPTVHYIPDFITPGEEDALMDALSADGGWTDLGKRRLKHYGGVPDPSGVGMVAEPLPSFAAEVCEAIAANAAWEGDDVPNQLLCNEYAPGGGIGRHLDGPMFRPAAAILSMGSQATINFWPGDGGMEDGAPSCQVLLMPRSLLVFRGDAYLAYPHSIEGNAEDEVSADLCNYSMLPGGMPARVPRRRRLSLTVRRVEHVVAEDEVIVTGEQEVERRRRRAQFEKGVDERRR